MHDLHEQVVHCPYCGESITVLLDPSVEQQEYIEDCQVCCRPIVMQVQFDGSGTAQLLARSENE